MWDPSLLWKVVSVLVPVLIGIGGFAMNRLYPGFLVASLDFHGAQMFNA